MSFQTHFSSHYSLLNPTEQAAFSMILDAQPHCATLNAVETAKFCCLSRSSLMRALAKIGYPSFADFKLDLSMNRVIEPKPLTRSIGEQFRTLLRQLILHADFSQIVSLLKSRQSIYIYGTGNEQKAIASYFKALFFNCKVCVIDLFDEAEIEFCKPRMNQQDLMIFVSLSGKNEHLAQIASLLSLQTHTLAITRSKENPLAFCCTSSIYVSTDESEDHRYEMISGFYLLIDQLYLQYQKFDGADNASQRIRQALWQCLGSATLSSLDQYIATILIQEPLSILNLSTQQIRDQYHISISALSRFGKTAGFSGYAQLRAYLRLAANGNTPALPEESNLFLGSYLKMLEALEHQDLSSLFDRMQQAKRIFVVSLQGSSALLASEFVRIFLPAGLPIYHYAGHSALENLALQSSEDDLLIVFSTLAKPDKNLTSALIQIGHSGSRQVLIKRLDSLEPTTTFQWVLNAFSPLKTDTYPLLGPFLVLTEMLYLKYIEYNS